MFNGECAGFNAQSRASTERLSSKRADIKERCGTGPATRNQNLMLCPGEPDNGKAARRARRLNGAGHGAAAPRLVLAP
jgi:hypothetical protein